MIDIRYQSPEDQGSALGKYTINLTKLAKEGKSGHEKITQYTRYATVILCLVQSFFIARWLESPARFQGLQIVADPGWGFRILTVLTLTTGTIFIMWLGEQISLYGVGNGASMLIFAGIVSRMPDLIARTVQYVNIGTTDVISVAIIAAFFILIVACIVYLEKGERKIPVQYARRIVGNRIYGGQSSYIPFKINPVGVMPVIFASAALQWPMIIFNVLGAKFESLRFLSDIINSRPVFLSLEFVLIIFFTFLYTALVFNPDELADNIKKNGGFIAGIRPGKKTAQFFDYILNRIGLVGAIYLGILAVVPDILRSIFDVPFLLTGISLLIAVGVAMEASAQIETFLIEHRYEGFLSSGRVKNRIMR